MTAREPKDRSALVVDESQWEAWARSIGSPTAGDWREVLPPNRNQGFDVDALYWQHDGAGEGMIPRPRAVREHWVEIPDSTPQAATHRLGSLSDWEVNGAWLNGGVAGEWSSADFSGLLAKWPESVAIGFGGGLRTDAATPLLQALEERSLAGLTGTLSLDPIGEVFASSDAASLAVITTAQRRLQAVGSPLRAILVDTSVVADRGAEPALEVAYALALFAEYARELMESGLDAEAACGQIVVALSLGRDVGLQIAKVRALKWVLRLLVSALGADPGHRAEIHGRTAWRTLSVYAPENNMLRGTLETLSGMLGGLASVAVRPFDSLLAELSEPGEGNAGRLASRLAASTPRILELEGGLLRYPDPACGSWYLEALTEGFARTAWQHFQKIERLGGASVGVGKGGYLESHVANSSVDRREAVEGGTLDVVGVSTFPNPEEALDPRFLDRNLDSAAERWRDAAPLEERRRQAEREDG